MYSKSFVTWNKNNLFIYATGFSGNKRPSIYKEAI